jgi:protein subunit release factor B
MSIFNVSPRKERELLERMLQMNVSEKDIKETFIRSPGPGGQKVNKTSSCVALHHIPTGIKIKCYKDRSQALNRFFARRMLLDQIEIKQKGYTGDEIRRISRIRNQKRRSKKKGTR